MQKRSHKLLASALLKSQQGFPARRYEWAFLFGSFQPDCNPLTYLKGSLHGPRFHGHCYPGSRDYVLSRIRLLQQRQHWTLWQYYTLGKLTHYLADAFTYPHNDIFPEGPLDHHRYESELRRYFASYLAQRQLRRETLGRDLAEALEDLHRQYLAAPGAGVDQDVRYILQANLLLMAGCLPASAEIWADS